MKQRFTLNRKSFEDFLAAASVVQHLQKQATSQRAFTESSEPLLSLLQLQRAIRTETIDVDTAITSVVQLARSVLEASSAGIWLFRDSETLACCAIAGPMPDLDRMGPEVLAHLTQCDRTGSDHLTFSNMLGKSSHYPGYPNSAALAPVRVNGSSIGAIAAFSTNFEAFSPRDLDNLHFLANLLEQAVRHAMKSGYRDAVALEHSMMVKMLASVQSRLNDLQTQLQTSAQPEPAAVEDRTIPELVPAVENRTIPEPMPAVDAELTASELEDDPVATPQLPELLQPSEALSAVQTHDDASASDVSLYGIGVRAALGDVPEFSGEPESEPFFLAALWRRAASSSANIAANCRTGLRNAIGKTSLLLHRAPRPASTKYEGPEATPATEVPRGTWVHALRTHKFKIHMAGMPGLRRLRLATSARIGAVYSRVSQAHSAITQASYAGLRGGRERLGQAFQSEPADAHLLRKKLRQARVNLSDRLNEQRIRMRIRNRSRQRALATSAETTARVVQTAGESIASGTRRTRRLAVAAMTAVKAEVSALQRPRINGYTLRRSAGAVVILAIMGAFVALQGTARSRYRAVGATPARATLRPASNPVELAPEPASRKRADYVEPITHLQITDAPVAESLHDLTRYEIRTLQRAADYGNDDAAFQLGMAYETGYYLRQSCEKAAHWVKVAAEAGNAAAAYNLGLRYREGDGVPVDDSAAEHWLRVASTQKYSPAKLALTSMR